MYFIYRSINAQKYQADAKKGQKKERKCEEKKREKKKVDRNWKHIGT